MTHFNFDKFLSDFCTTLIFHKFIYHNSGSQRQYLFEEWGLMNIGH